MKHDTPTSPKPAARCMWWINRLNHECGRPATWVADTGRRELLLCSAHKGAMVRQKHYVERTYLRLDEWMGRILSSSVIE